VWEVHAGQRAGAEVVCALCLLSLAPVFRLEVGLDWRHTTLVLRLIPGTITPYVLRLLVLLVALVAEHLVEEAELRGGGDEPGA
jgi:hypothetical protein